MTATLLNPADQPFAVALAALLPAGTVSAPEPRHLEEPRGLYHGKGGLLARPRTTDEVGRIVAACAKARVGIVPLSGGTGLVGGQVLPDGPAPLILSLERMDRIRAIHADEGAMIAEAGAVLANVQGAARDAGRLFAMSIASEGSARIGGLLSTNAGGMSVLRHGNMRDLCLGLEAIMPDGRVLHGLKRLRKDNTGYDLRHLLIGAEGTLGIITAAALRLLPPPAREGAAYLAVASPDAALALLALAQDRTGGAVSIFELIHAQGFDFIAETGLKVRVPLHPVPEWSVLMELGLPSALDPEVEFAAIYETALARGLVGDAVIARSEADRRDFRHLRETLPEANRLIGPVASHDIALPLSQVGEFLNRAGPALARVGQFRINCFGHLGDGNLHYNVFPPKGESAAALRPRRDAVRRTVYDLATELGGTFSAEHGIGRMKVDELERYGDPVKLSAMRAIKQALDPQGIMNPGAVLKAPP